MEKTYTRTLQTSCQWYFLSKLYESIRKLCHYDNNGAWHDGFGGMIDLVVTITAKIWALYCDLKFTCESNKKALMIVCGILLV